MANHIWPFRRVQLPVPIILALFVVQTVLLAPRLEAQQPSVLYFLQRVSNDLVANVDRFGHSVAISGDTMVVGAYGKDNSAGAVYLFYRNQGATNNWGQFKKLLASDRASGDQFGFAVSMMMTPS